MVRNFFRYTTLFLLLGGVISCTSQRYTAESSKTSVDSSLIKVELPDPKLRYFNDSTLLFSNAFASARLNEITQVNDSTFQITIRPENTPINHSPWYGFKVWSKTPSKVYLSLQYGTFKHRYHPKTSRDGKTWTPVEHVKRSKDRKTASFAIQVDADTLQVSAQERIDAASSYAWIDDLAQLPIIKKETIGHSILGQPIVALSTPEVDSHKAVVFLSRQHPPEVTGFLAHQSFMAEILGDTELAKRFRQEFQILAIPMVNPDGVDAGHWRHSMGGVDLNRDWEDFKQPETRAIRDFLDQKVKKEDLKIYFGLDFHSTFHDVYYINENVAFSFVPGFSEEWIASIEKNIPGYTASVKPSSNGSNVSKSWLSRHFGTEAITYEVGDATDREQVALIARTAAQQMMQILLDKE